MTHADFDNTFDEHRPRTVTVLLLLVVAALTLSYLASYAVSDALVNANVLAAWSPGADPRPTWMLKSFLGLCGAFAVIGTLARTASHRQLRRLDALAEE